jgi:hypothetical protein
MIAATLILRQGEVLSLRLPGRPLRLACIAGRLWATTSRSAADHLLAPGEARTFRGRGILVVQALRIATLRIATLRIATARNEPSAAAADLLPPPVLHSARRSQPWEHPSLQNPTLLRTL